MPFSAEPSLCPTHLFICLFAYSFIIFTLPYCIGWLLPYRNLASGPRAFPTALVDFFSREALLVDPALSSAETVHFLISYNQICLLHASSLPGFGMVLLCPSSSTAFTAECWMFPLVSDLLRRPCSFLSPFPPAILCTSAPSVCKRCHGFASTLPI